MRKSAPEPAGATYCGPEVRAACGAEASVTATTSAARATRTRGMRRPALEGSFRSVRTICKIRLDVFEATEPRLPQWRPGLFVFLANRARRENGLRGEQEPGDIGPGDGQGGH